MDNNTTDVLSTDDPPSGPEFDGIGFDANEEILLLRMTDTSNGAISPNLQAMLDEQADFSWPLPQGQQSPLLMERPPSPGIEAAAFSFAKPTQNGRPFSLQPILRRPSLNTNQDKPDKNGDVTANSSVDGSCVQNQVTVRSRAKDTERPTSSRTVDNPSRASERGRDQNQRDLSPMVLNTETQPSSRISLDCHAQQALPPQEVRQNNEQQVPNEVAIPNGEVLEFSGIMRDSFPEETRNSVKILDALDLPRRQDTGQGDVCESRPESQYWKVAKRSHIDRRKAAKRIPNTASGSSTEVPEEALFQQLITRLRAREESEAVASNMQKEMEASIAALSEENAILKEDLELLSSKLQKRTAETRAYKSQTDLWKSKLAKVKVFLNEIETGYQNLRGEAIHFKATRKALDKERKEIVESVEEVKARMIQISQASGERRGCLLDAENLIASMGQELKYAREKVQYSQNQLVDEKKRSRLLELYIQSCSRAQDKKLDLLKNNHYDVIDRLESVFEATTKNHESSSAVISSGLDQKLEVFFTQVAAATESLSNGKLNVQQCRETIAMFESRMDTTIRQLVADTESQSKNAELLVQNLDEHIKEFKDSVSDGSTLVEQLSSSEDRCRNLQTVLEETLPAFSNLDHCINGLQEREVDLRQQMQDLNTKLSEIKLPDRFKDNYVHISEKLRLEAEMQQLTATLKLTEKELEVEKNDNAQKQDELHELAARTQAAESNAAESELELQKKTEASIMEKHSLDREIQRLQSEIELVREGSRLQQLENTQKQDEMRELTARAHQAETNVARLEAHAANLEQNIEETKRAAQKNAENAIASSRKQCEAEFERRLQEKIIEIREVEMDRQRIANQLSELQRRLMEVEKSHREQREDREILLAEQQKRIQDLEALRADQASRIAKQVVEIEQIKSREVTLTAQHSDLLEKFDEVHERLNSLQVDLLKTMGDDQLSRKTQEDYVSIIQAELTKKREDCITVQNKLSSIQDRLVEKEQECQALQDSLSATEGELAGTKDRCKELQSSFKSLQGKVANHEETHRTLQAALSTNEIELRKKEEQYQIVSKELEEANSVRSILESGKSKAKAEILALLKRVQTSELAVKSVTETLIRLDVAQHGHSLKDSLEQLERALGAATAIKLASGERDSMVRTPETFARDRKANVQNESYYPGQAEKIIKADGLREKNEDFDELSPCKKARNIIPFSSILEGLSPTHFSVPDEEPFDLSCVLTQTPLQGSASQQPSIPAEPENNKPLTESASGIDTQEVKDASEKEPVVNTQQTNPKCTQAQLPSSAPNEQGLRGPQDVPVARKVSFMTRGSTAEVDSLQVPDSQEKSVQENGLKPMLDGAQLTRTSRWTYSKRQRETSAKQEETMAAERVSSQNGDRQMQSKKVKTSSTTNVVRQTKTATELYGRRQSPTRLASGSSRASSSARYLDQTGSTEGRRRSGRRTRGDKYNARFSQGA